MSGLSLLTDLIAHRCQLPEGQVPLFEPTICITCLFLPASSPLARLTCLFCLSRSLWLSVKKLLCFFEALCDGLGTCAGFLVSPDDRMCIFLSALDPALLAVSLGTAVHAKAGNSCRAAGLSLASVFDWVVEPMSLIAKTWPACSPTTRCPPSTPPPTPAFSTSPRCLHD